VVTTGPAPTRRYLVEAWHREHGWLRFGLRTTDPRPLPFAGGVEIGQNIGRDWSEPLVPEFLDDLVGGYPGGDGAFHLKELGTFSLPEGSAPDLASSGGKSWEKALRRLRVDGGEVTAVMARPELRGKAKGVADDIQGYLGK
jgi:hypothetical protein